MMDTSTLSQALFTLGGVPFTVTAHSWKFFPPKLVIGIVVALVLLPDETIAARVVWGIIFGLLLLLALFLHIIGHILSSKLVTPPMTEAHITPMLIQTLYRLDSPNIAPPCPSHPLIGRANHEPLVGRNLVSRNAKGRSLWAGFFRRREFRVSGFRAAALPHRGWRSHLARSPKLVQKQARTMINRTDAMSSPDLSGQTLTLRDGRTLGYAEWGDFDGKPVFFFGGSNSAVKADPNVAPAIGRCLAGHIPNCKAPLVPNAGHFLMFTHWREIVLQCVAGWTV